MKKLFYSILILIFSFQTLLAQNPIQSNGTPNKVNYDVMKSSGQMNPYYNYQWINPTPASHTPVIHDNSSRSIVCNCDIQLDTTFSVAQFDCSGGSGGPGLPPEYRNDDWSTCAIPLPFTFCLYGTNYTSLYINNNGNVSFDAPYSTFTSTPFPNNQVVMVAPFWADVDTRDNTLPDTSGIVYYKLTPTALIVKWNHVGYYGIHADLVNTFQLIITDGTDPLLPGGNNVSFCYQDMQWTTGDASSGVGGFGGTPATVGANLGDAIHHIQFGQFDHPGNDYTGPTGISGVSWLDNQSITFNTCTQNNNVSPVQVGLNECDTIEVCSGDTVPFNVSFYSPEANQTTTATATTSALGFSILSNTPGNTAIITAQLIANPANSGYNIITFTGTDDNVPPATTTVPIVVYIRPFAAPLPVISGPNSFCAPGSVTLSVQSGYASVLWSNNATTDSITVGAGTYSVIVTDSNGCHASAGPFTVTVNSSLNPVITGPQGVCPNTTTLISVAQYTQYLWSTSATTQSVTVGAGTYTVTVTDAAGCTGTATYTVAQFPQPTLTTCGDPSICLGDSALLCLTGADSYTWSPATGLSATTGSSVMAGPAVTTTYTIIGQNNTTLCSDTATITITVNPLPLVASPPAPSICSGGSVQICMTGAQTYHWQPSTGIIAASGPDSTCVTVSVSSSITYTVTGFSAEGCQASITVTVTVNPNPVPVIIPLGPTVFCAGGSVDLQATPTGTYAWSTSANTQIINVTSSGSFTVTVTDANGCTGVSAPVSVTVNPLPTPSISPAAPAFCQGDSVVLTASGGTGFSWSNNSSSQSITVNSSGTYTVTVTDANGCISSTSVNVTVNPPPPAVISPAGPVLICSNNPATLTANSGPGYTYQWYLNGNPIPGATNQTYDASVTGMYSVRVTDAIGCTSLSTEVQVMQGAGPVVTIQGPPQIGCLAQNTIYIGYGPQSATLTAVSSTAVTYLWSTGATTQSISVTTSGTYSVIGYDANGCPSDSTPESQITITVIDIRCGHGLKKILFCHVPEGNPGNPQTICIPATAVASHLALHQYDCIGPCSLYYNRESPVMDDETKVNLYPNPFSNTFIIDIENFSGETVLMNMYDVTGRLLISEMKLTETIELGADLSKGVYHVEIITGEKRESYKIVKL